VVQPGNIEDEQDDEKDKHEHHQIVDERLHIPVDRGEAVKEEQDKACNDEKY
jgi:hypothetical protein